MKALEDKKVGLFYGSDTGNTEDVARRLVEKWDYSEIEVVKACDMKVEDYAKMDFIFLGLSTWYDGELQSDFESFYDDFQTINFTDKVVALFGLGDQFDYEEYFIDGVGLFADVVMKNGGMIVGLWPTADYQFEASKALYDEEYFYGLALDNDSEKDKTEERLDAWLKQLAEEIPQVYGEKELAE
ncbi:MAG: flavodoxin I [Algoriphagus sp.]|jgi:flavodoxin I